MTRTPAGDASTHMAADSDWAVNPLGASVGAEVVGLDLSKPLSDPAFEDVRKAFERYRVLAFRDQKLTKHDLLVFSERWGSVGGHVQRADAVHVITNADENGRPKGRLPETGALHYHIDKSYMARPAFATFLYAVEVPPEKGDTVFADAQTAYEALPAETKERIDSLSVWHSLEWFSRTTNNKLSQEALRNAPPVLHPLVRTDPVTGKKSLYIGNNAWKVDGWTFAESRNLIEDLNDFATQSQFLYWHKWRQGDLVMWDNRCLLHAATEFDASKYLRTLYRTVIEVTSDTW
jgi:alpha-ketoglutarate-dependent taurine dioxygenase